MKRHLRAIWIALTFVVLGFGLFLADGEMTLNLVVLAMLILSLPSGLLVFIALLGLSWLEGRLLGEGTHIASIAFILLSWVSFFAAGYYQWFGRRSQRATTNVPMTGRGDR